MSQYDTKNGNGIFFRFYTWKKALAHRVSELKVYLKQLGIFILAVEPRLVLRF